MGGKEQEEEEREEEEEEREEEREEVTCGCGATCRRAAGVQLSQFFSSATVPPLPTKTCGSR